MTTVDDRQAVKDILDFWFAEETKPRWYESTKAFDERCRERFGGLVERAAHGELAAWEASADGALALCLLLDQMPRNLFRGTAKAFGTDDDAVAVTSLAIEKGFDQELEAERRKFLYLPLMHSERLTDQERGILVYKALGDEKSLDYAREHADIIRRFGRFPHRNAIVGRESTPEEEAFLADGAKTYGQSTTDKD